MQENKGFPLPLREILLVVYSLLLCPQLLPCSSRKSEFVTLTSRLWYAMITIVIKALSTGVMKSLGPWSAILWFSITLVVSCPPRKVSRQKVR